MQYLDQLPTKDEIEQLLAKLFGFESIGEFELIKGGHLCQNFVLNADGKKYFLKQYRHKLSQVVYQIKRAEQIFADKGIRVIPPLRDCRYGRTAFYFGRNWYSLFAFVDHQSITSADLTRDGLRSLGHQLGEIHTVGLGAMPSAQPLFLWDKDRFKLESCELEMKLEEIGALDSKCALIANVLERKRAFVEHNDFLPEEVVLPFDTLLHGDFGCQNVFLSPDQRQVEHVFDFEKTSRGPRTFEVARAIFMSAFDNGWDEACFDNASIFLRAYQEAAPISFIEFKEGIRIYMTHMAHQLWIEWKVLVRGDIQHIPILLSHSRRVEHLGDDFDEVARSIYQRATK